MSDDWRKLQTYCYGCKKWYDTFHTSVEMGRRLGRKEEGCCPAGGGQDLINIETFQLYCTACQRYSRPEDGIFTCHKGHRQKLLYSDSTVVLQVGDRILAYDGNIAYVLTRLGTLITTHRKFINIRGN